MSVPNGNVGLIVSYLLGGVVVHGDIVLARRLITSQAGALHLDGDSRTALLPDLAQLVDTTDFLCERHPLRKHHKHLFQS